MVILEGWAFLMSEVPLQNLELLVAPETRPPDHNRPDNVPCCETLAVQGVRTGPGWARLRGKGFQGWALYVL